MLVIFDLFLVAADLSIEFIDQFINSGIQVFVGTFGKHVIAFDVYIAFSALSSVFFFLIFY